MGLKIGRKWSAIARMMTGRTGEAVKVRWTSLNRQRQAHSKRRGGSQPESKKRQRTDMHNNHGNTHYQYYSTPGSAVDLTEQQIYDILDLAEDTETVKQTEAAYDRPGRGYSMEW